MVTFNYDAPEALVFFVAVTHRDFRASKLTPSRMPVLGGTTVRGQRLVLIPGPAIPLIKRAARRGFRGMTVEHLKKLHKLEVPRQSGVPVPTTEADLVIALVRQELGEIADSEIEAILEARGTTMASWEESKPQLFETGALDWVEDVIDMEDLEGEIHELQQKAAAKRDDRGAAAPRPAEPDPSGAAGSSALAVQPAPTGPQRIADPGPGIDVEWARTLLPPETLLAWEPESQSWRVSGRYISRRRSRAAGPLTMCTEWEALKFVLAIAWTAFKESNEVDCPYIFD